MASRSKLTECIDIRICIPFTSDIFLLEGGVLGLILSAIALVIRDRRLLILIP
jgi:hypothetical protein